MEKYPKLLKKVSGRKGETPFYGLFVYVLLYQEGRENWLSPKTRKELCGCPHSSFQWCKFWIVTSGRLAFGKYPGSIISTASLQKTLLTAPHHPA